MMIRSRILFASVLSLGSLALLPVSDLSIRQTSSLTEFPRQALIPPPSLHRLVCDQLNSETFSEFIETIQQTARPSSQLTRAAEGPIVQKYPHDCADPPRVFLNTRYGEFFC